MTWPFASLTPLSYDLIVADPPWRFRTWGEHNQTKSASRHYDLMYTRDIEALPVDRLAQKDCVLFLWATGAMLPQALAVMASWGFVYKSMMAWRKVTPAGRVRMGTGYWTRSMHEPILLGTIGKPSKVSGFPSLFDGLAREHSRKPDEFYALVRKHSTGLRCADLFSRESRDGFDGWGAEIGKFSSSCVASHPHETGAADAPQFQHHSDAGGADRGGSQGSGTGGETGAGASVGRPDAVSPPPVSGGETRPAEAGNGHDSGGAAAVAGGLTEPECPWHLIRDPAQREAARRGQPGRAA